LGDIAIIFDAALLAQQLAERNALDVLADRPVRRQIGPDRRIQADTVFVQDADGGAKACISQNRAIISAVQAAGDSMIVITLKPNSANSNGVSQCMGVTVVNSSEYGPK